MREFFSGLNKKLIVAMLLVGQVIAPLTAIINTAPVSADSDILYVEDKEANVGFSKSAKAVEGMNGYVDITLTAQGPVKCEPKPIRVVVVFDKSGSMGDDGKIDVAKSATNNFVKELFNNNCVIPEVAMVSFSNSASLSMGWQNSIENYNKNVSFGRAEGGTNIQHAIALASSTLDAVTNVPAEDKFIVLMSDGEPTFCPGTNSWGSLQSCESTVAGSLSKVDGGGNGSDGYGAATRAIFYNALTSVSTEIKNKKTTIFTVGYDTAARILDTIATSKDHYKPASTADLAQVLSGFLTGPYGVATQHAGIDATIYDTIHDDFEFASTTDSKVSVSGNKVTCEVGKIYTDGTSCTFRIKVKQSTICDIANNSGGFKELKTNDGASLEFTSIATSSDVKLEIKESPKYLYFVDEESIGCAPGQLSVTKVMFNKHDNRISFDANEKFNVTIKIEDVDNNPYPYGYKLDTEDEFTEYTADGIRVSLATGETVTVYLEEVIYGGQFGFTVTEETPDADKQLFCWGGDDCQGNIEYTSQVLTNSDIAPLATIKNVYRSIDFCQVIGKENLPADSPLCKEDEPELCPTNPALLANDPDCFGGSGGGEIEIPYTGYKRAENSSKESANVLLGVGITMFAVIAVGAVRKYQK